MRETIRQDAVFVQVGDGTGVCACDVCAHTCSVAVTVFAVPYAGPPFRCAQVLDDLSSLCSISSQDCALLLLMTFIQVPGRC
jgi:hypothetical protein